MTAVPTVISGSAVAGQAVRKVVSRSALAATWCASMIAAVTIAPRIHALFTAIFVWLPSIRDQGYALQLAPGQTSSHVRNVAASEPPV